MASLVVLFYRSTGARGMPPAANDEVIEGEWHEVDDNRDRLQ